MPATALHLARVLVIEDDPALNDQIADALRDHGCQPCQCLDGEAGLLMAISQRFDLVLLSIHLPKLAGLAVLRQFRQQSQSPVIILSTSATEHERIQGYREGADDYLLKPFNFTELLLRVEALLRRSMGVESASADSAEIRLGELILNRRSQAVQVADCPVQLTPVQFKLLWMLALHQGETISKPCLYQLVLEREFSRHDRSLDMHVCRVRRKLVAAGMPPDCLRTLHGKGYSFG